MMSYKSGAIFLIFLSLNIFCYSQQEINVNVSPTISKAIKGEKDLNRTKYFSLGAQVSELRNVLTTPQRDYYMDDLEMTVGRKLQMVSSNVKWGNNVREDAARPGFADLNYLMSQSNPNDTGLEYYKDLFGNRQGLACHDGHDAYPEFMNLYTNENTKNEKLPGNTDAAAELAANLLKYTFTEFQRPSHFELVNEPHWKFWGDQRFYDLHTKTLAEVKALDLDVKIGGPCYSVSNFYKKEYDNLTQITNFIDGTQFSLDFYSFHSYDYMRWDDDAHDFVGSISSGLPLEGVFDAIAAHTYNKYNSEFKFVGSEHGGYLTDGANRTYALDTLANTHFPGSGFEFEMEKRSIDNFIMVNSAIANTMTYMNHPHIVEKSVPFILLESSNWDPYYYSSLLVKENFNKSSTKWVESRLIDFHKFFKDVRGRRVNSFCYDVDIQHFAFVDDKTLVLLFHNQSNEEGSINVNIDEINNTVDSIRVRRLKRKVDFRPDFKEEKVSSIDAIAIGSQESIAVFITYDKTIPEEEDWNEEIFYSKKWDQRFNGSQTFIVDLPSDKTIKNAILRVGLSRTAARSKEVDIIVNGTKVNAPIEDCADRITTDYYATTKIIKLDPGILIKSNLVQVSFPDGQSGGVGAVVIRAVLEDESSVVNKNNINKKNSLLKIFPNPAADFLVISNEGAGTIEILDMNNRLVKIVETEIAPTHLSLDGISNGTYIVRFTDEHNVITEKLTVID